LEKIRAMGGLQIAKDSLLQRPGRDAKIDGTNDIVT
jgi:hypothetical protein